LNFGELLSSMPETETAEKELQAFNDELVAKGTEMEEKLNVELEAYLKARDSGTESPIQLAAREEKLQQGRNELASFQQKAQTDLNNKRQELLGPVIEKATEAIEAVAKEGSYLLIFDTSVFNAVLFADESIDVMDKVKAKLGLQ
ncbi:MAG: OmpH family outer membrane protein, partial [Bacteroidota bacterium]